MHKRILAVALVLGSVLAGCDLISRASADKVMVGSVLSSPPISFTPSAMVGWTPSGGSDGGTVTVPGQTLGAVFFGDRDGTKAPDGIAGATVTVGPKDGTLHTLEDKDNGNYLLDSAKTPAFSYTPGKSYQFKAKHSGTDYLGSVENAPAPETIDAFHPSQGYVSHAANQSFSFTRPALTSGTERNIGFVTVVPISDSGEKGTPTYTNVPTKPSEFLELALNPAEWKKDIVTIPATAFPTAQTTYLIGFQSVKLGGPEGTNLFVGSTFMVGSGDVAVLRVP